MKESPKILYNAKDFPLLPSGYGLITKKLTPLLAKQLGGDSILIYAPVYQRDHIDDFQGMKVLPGTRHDFGEDMILDHYQNFQCNMLLQVGDWFQFTEIPKLAAEDRLVWVHWGPWDWLNEHEGLIQMLRFPLKFVPFAQYTEQKLRSMNVSCVTEAIYPGVDPEIFKPRDPREYPQAMASLGFEEGAFNIVMMQANQGRKCIREQLEALAYFRQQHPEIKLRLYLHTTIQGERDLTMDLDELKLVDCTTAFDQYQLMLGGMSEQEVGIVFSLADVVLDVCMEGFGLSVVQANACGVPAVYLEEGASKELCRFGVGVPTFSVDRRHALLKPIPNPAHIAAALEHIYQEKQAGRGRSQVASDWVRENITWERCAQSWVQVIDEVMEIRWRHSYTIPEPAQHLLDQSREVVELSP